MLELDLAEPATPARQSDLPQRTWSDEHTLWALPAKQFLEMVVRRGRRFGVSTHCSTSATVSDVAAAADAVTASALSLGRAGESATLALEIGDDLAHVALAADGSCSVRVASTTMHGARTTLDRLLEALPAKPAEAAAGVAVTFWWR